MAKKRERDIRLPWLDGQQGEDVRKAIGGMVREIGTEGSWFSENVKIIPTSRVLYNDVDKIFDKYIFNHYYPEKPFLEEQANLVTMGSCFARHLRAQLAARGKVADQLYVPEELLNTAAIAEYIDWVITGNNNTTYLWYDNDENHKPQRWDKTLHEYEHDRLVVHNQFKNADMFIITLGLSEVWRDKVTGGIFWRGIPAEIHDPERHEHIVLPVADNVANIWYIYNKIQEFCGAPVLISLSPVPLRGSFQDRPAIVSDTVSKATLRVALHEFFEAKPENAYYWPSYEAVTWVSQRMNKSFFTAKGQIDPRHVEVEIVSKIIERFVNHFYKG